jgi:hypothetical protein
MYTIDHCLACKTLDIKLEPAKIAQFVIWKATNNFVYENVDTHGVVCKKCSFVASQHRLTDDEETNLYRDYRGEEYNNKRIFCEPFYQASVDKFSSDQYMLERKAGINQLLDKHITDVLPINYVLDYGGDTGSHIPDRFIKSKLFVSDISGVTPLPGIQVYNPRLGNLVADFLMCCHVLEHKSDPDILIKELKLCMKPSTWLYVEVPNFTFPLQGGVFHEHINRFNIRSMTALLNRNGIDVVDHLINPTMGGDCLCVLAKLGV